MATRLLLGLFEFPTTIREEILDFFGYGGLRAYGLQSCTLFYFVRSLPGCNIDHGPVSRLGDRTALAGRNGPLTLEPAGLEVAVEYATILDN